MDFLFVLLLRRQWSVSFDSYFASFRLWYFLCVKYSLWFSTTFPTPTNWELSVGDENIVFHTRDWSEGSTIYKIIACQSSDVLLRQHPSVPGWAVGTPNWKTFPYLRWCAYIPQKWRIFDAIYSTFNWWWSHNHFHTGKCDVGAAGEWPELLRRVHISQNIRSFLLSTFEHKVVCFSYSWHLHIFYHLPKNINGRHPIKMKRSDENTRGVPVERHLPPMDETSIDITREDCTCLLKYPSTCNCFHSRDFSHRCVGLNSKLHPLDPYWKPFFPLISRRSIICLSVLQEGYCRLNVQLCFRIIFALILISCKFQFWIYFFTTFRQLWYWNRSYSYYVRRKCKYCQPIPKIECSRTPGIRINWGLGLVRIPENSDCSKKLLKYVVNLPDHPLAHCKILRTCQPLLYGRDETKTRV